MTPFATPTTLRQAASFRQRELSRAVHQVLLTGAVTLALGLQASGLVYAANLPAVIELSDLDGSDGYVLNGINSGDHSGSSVSNAGDVNGDGVDDLLIGAPFAKANFFDKGESYVVFGGSGVGSTGMLELSDLNGINGFVINGAGKIDQSGGSVSSAGDVNGDGLNDLIIGASGANPNDKTAAGVSHVLFGGIGVGSTGVVELSDLNGTDGFVINGVEPGDRSGSSVNGAGDVNGDGIADLIIGAPDAGSNDNISSGESYVVFGGTGVGSTGVLELSDLDGSNGFVLHGSNKLDQSGTSVSGAGDVNGDGVDDLLIGAPTADPRAIDAGESYIVFGRSGVGSTGSLELSDLDGTDGFVLQGFNKFDQSGSSVSGAGDVNGDGVDDLLVAAVGARESYVLFGGSSVGSTGVLKVFFLDGANGFVLNGAGSAVSRAGDVNGDGIGDLMIGSDVGSPNGFRSGISYVVFGGSEIGSTGVLELSDLDGTDGFALNGVDEVHLSGHSVSNAGDVNSDSVDDVMIGAPGFGGVGKSRSYVVFGLATDPQIQCNGLPVTVDLNLGETPTSGDDVIIGTPAADRINALAGNDTICGEGGNDIIGAGSGNDWVEGGSGDDVIRGGSGDDELHGEAGDDSILGNSGNDTIEGGDGVDGIDGGAGNDIIYTGSGATVASGVSVLGGSGMDIIYGGPDADYIRGNNGADIISGEGGDDEINGGAGNDLINGGAGHDQLRGGQDNDEVRGSAGNDWVLGDSGDDVLRGGSGTDIVDGGEGNDTLAGGASSDDVCDGNAGTDTASSSCETTTNVP